MELRSATVCHVQSRDSKARDNLGQIIKVELIRTSGGTFQSVARRLRPKDGEEGVTLVPKAKKPELDVWGYNRCSHSRTEYTVWLLFSFL